MHRPEKIYLVILVVLLACIVVAFLHDTKKTNEEILVEEAILSIR